jgi:hypothetical protein
MEKIIACLDLSRLSFEQQLVETFFESCNALEFKVAH